MRFLLFLLQETIGKKYVQAGKRTINWKNLSEISTKLYRQGKATTDFRDVKSLRQVLEIYNKLTQKEKEMINDYFYRVHHNMTWNQTSDFLSWMTELHLILKKQRAGKPVNRIDELFVNAARDIFMTKTPTYKPIMSSWLVRCKYTKSSKRLWVVMKRGTAVYKFVGVPEIDYLYLITIAYHGGTMWWAEGYGLKYSTNPHKWVKKGDLY